MPRGRSRGDLARPAGVHTRMSTLVDCANKIMPGSNDRDSESTHREALSAMRVVTTDDDGGVVAADIPSQLLHATDVQQINSMISKRHHFLFA